MLEARLIIVKEVETMDWKYWDVFRKYQNILGAYSAFYKIIIGCAGNSQQQVYMFLENN